MFDTNYVCVVFGPENGTREYWNLQTNHRTQRLAERHGLDSLAIAGVFGYVVIKETDDNSWKMVDELGAAKVFLGKEGQNYTVQPQFAKI